MKKNEVKNVEKLFEEVKELVKLTIVHFMLSTCQRYNSLSTGDDKQLKATFPRTLTY